MLYFGVAVGIVLMIVQSFVVYVILKIFYVPSEVSQQRTIQLPGFMRAYGKNAKRKPVIHTDEELWAKEQKETI